MERFQDALDAHSTSSDYANSSSNVSTSFHEEKRKRSWKRSRIRKAANTIKPRFTPGTVARLPFIDETGKVIIDYCLIEAVVINYRVRYTDDSYSSWMVGKVELLPEDELLRATQVTTDSHDKDFKENG